MAHRCGNQPRPDSIHGPSLRSAGPKCPVRRPARHLGSRPRPTAGPGVGDLSDLRLAWVAAAAESPPPASGGGLDRGNRGEEGDGNRAARKGPGVPDTVTFTLCAPEPALLYAVACPRNREPRLPGLLCDAPGEGGFGGHLGHSRYVALVVCGEADRAPAT